MWDNELAVVSLGASLLGLRTFNLPKDQRSCACICVHMHLSVHKPLDTLLFMIYHGHMTRGLLAMQHYTTYFKVPFIRK